jgi:DNA repair protein RecN (Recombination protein N)
LRRSAEAVEEDPERLAAIRERRQRLKELRRKYGETLADVIAYHREAAARLGELERAEARAAGLDDELRAARAELAAAAAAVGAQRRAAAPELAAEVEGHLTQLAMPRARVEISIGDDPGDDVEFLLGANAGEPALPLARVASGGELARTMLALRLVLTEAPDTLVFDEVDAGIGGAAAVAVAEALGRLGRRHQVLVVTHLAQVAAIADTQIVVTKVEEAGRTRATLAPVTGSARITEVSRMLAGDIASAAAQRHAEELLGRARARGA